MGASVFWGLAHSQFAILFEDRLVARIGKPGLASLDLAY